MALFGKKKVAEVKDVAVVKTPKASSISRNLAGVILRPVISEKAAVLGDRNIYTFEIARTATKHDVRAAVQKLWNVVPLKINIVNRVPRQFILRARNRRSTEAGIRKAYVYLKKDDRIELV